MLRCLISQQRGISAKKFFNIFYSSWPPLTVKTMKKFHVSSTFASSPGSTVKDRQLDLNRTMFGKWFIFISYKRTYSQLCVYFLMRLYIWIRKNIHSVCSIAFNDMTCFSKESLTNTNKEGPRFCPKIKKINKSEHIQTLYIQAS